MLINSFSILATAICTAMAAVPPTEVSSAHAASTNKPSAPLSSGHSLHRPHHAPSAGAKQEQKPLKPCTNAYTINMKDCTGAMFSIAGEGVQGKPLSLSHGNCNLTVTPQTNQDVERWQFMKHAQKIMRGQVCGSDKGRFLMPGSGNTMGTEVGGAQFGLAWNAAKPKKH